MTGDLELGIMRYPFPPVDYWTQNIQRDESAGWDAYWLPDQIKGEEPLSIWDPELVDLATVQESPHAFFETVAMLGYAAAKTDDIRLGVAVSETFRRHPIVLAQAMQTVHHLSGGRMLFGLGAGATMSTEPYGIEYRRPASRLEEALQLIRLAWETDQNETFDFEGDVWQLEDAVFALPPVEAGAAPPYPEIFLAANGPRTRSLAGRYADGWLPQFLPPSLYRDHREEVEAAATESGRDASAVSKGFVTAAILADTREEAEELLDSVPVRHQSIVISSEVFEAHGFDHPLDRGLTAYNPSQASRSEALDIAQEMPMAVLKDAYLWGTPDDVIAEIEAYREVGVEHLIVGNMTPMADVGRMEASEELMAEVREAVQS